MNDKLKNLRSTLNQTVFQENHFTEESRQQVLERIRKSQDDSYKGKKHLQFLKRPLMALMSVFVFCTALFLMFQSGVILEKPTDGNSDFPTDVSEETNQDSDELEVIQNLPPSVLEGLETQLQKSKDRITLVDLDEVKSLNISEEFDVQSVVELFNNLEQLTVYVPIDDWTFLNETPNLTRLSINNNNLDDLTFLQPLQKLEMLSVEGNNLKSLEGIEHLTSLESLLAGQNQISNLEPLQDMNNLSSLNLNDNEISSLEPIQDLEQLRNLTISRNPISDHSVLENFPNLTFLSMSENNISSLEFLEGMDSLNRLQIYNTDVSDLSVLADKTELEYLDVRETNVTTIEPLLNLEKLKILLLHKDKVEDWELLENKGGLKISEEVINAY